MIDGKLGVAGAVKRALADCAFPMLGGQHFIILGITNPESPVSVQFLRALFTLITVDAGVLSFVEFAKRLFSPADATDLRRHMLLLVSF